MLNVCTKNVDHLLKKCFWHIRKCRVKTKTNIRKTKNGVKKEKTEESQKKQRITSEKPGLFRVKKDRPSHLSPTCAYHIV